MSDAPFKFTDSIEDAQSTVLSSLATSTYSTGAVFGIIVGHAIGETTTYHAYGKVKRKFHSDSFVKVARTGRGRFTKSATVHTVCDTAGCANSSQGKR